MWSIKYMSRSLEEEFNKIIAWYTKICCWGRWMAKMFIIHLFRLSTPMGWKVDMASLYLRNINPQCVTVASVRHRFLDKETLVSLNAFHSSCWVGVKGLGFRIFSYCEDLIKWRGWIFELWYVATRKIWCSVTLKLVCQIIRVVFMTFHVSSSAMWHPLSPSDCQKDNQCRSMMNIVAHTKSDVYVWVILSWQCRKEWCCCHRTIGETGCKGTPHYFWFEAK